MGAHTLHVDKTFTFLYDSLTWLIVRISSLSNQNLLCVKPLICTILRVLARSSFSPSSSPSSAHYSHKPLQLSALSLDLRLLASSSCQPSCAAVFVFEKSFNVLKLKSQKCLHCGYCTDNDDIINKSIHSKSIKIFCRIDMNFGNGVFLFSLLCFVGVHYLGDSDHERMSWSCDNIYYSINKY
jgi:hypothetical protein